MAAKLAVLALLVLACICSVKAELGFPRSPSRCKNNPRSHHWPSPAKWSALNHTLGGRLLAPVPPAAVCHPDHPSYNREKCNQVSGDWDQYNFHVNDPVSIMWSQYVNDTCLPDPLLPCSTTGYPSFVINATTPQHVKLGVDFARKHSIRVSVKNTGHDYLGRASAPNALSIWTRHMQTLQTHPNGYHLGGYKGHHLVPGTAVTVGAGMVMSDIFEHLDRLNQTIVGGSGRTVGVAGYVTGGGHSPLSPRYGLAADNVLEMELVTPTGDIVVANEFTNRSLFWALRGGGGSTFGIITSITLKTHPSPRMLGVQLMITTDVEEPFGYDLAAYILSQLPTLGDKGLSGLAAVFPRMANPVPSPGSPKEVAGVLGKMVLQDTSDPEDILELWRPINETIQEKWPGKVQFISSITAYSSYLDWLEGSYFDNSTTGVGSYLASRLLDELALTQDIGGLADGLKIAAESTGGLTAILSSGKGVHKAQGNAVNPGWRTSYVLAVTGLSFEPHNITAKEEAANRLNDAMQPFRELSPDTGSYLNEALPQEPAWQRSFWGDNYERLARIKRRVDPDDVLWCARCVGGERWIENEDGELCRARSD